ncbi:MAG: hypothetical protein AAF911_04000 [Planctomycetota bacterium]
MVLLTGCVSNQQYNLSQEQYLTELVTSGHETTGVDLAIIEFDEFGMLWDQNQLNDTLDLIAARNAESERGIMLVTYTHGWMNNANPDRLEGDLIRFRDGMLALAAELHAEGAPAPDHVVGVYLGWRGATNRVPVWSYLSFWNRKHGAERVASYQMRETLFRLTDTAKRRSDTKVLLSGHSMGGMILARTLAPTLSTLLLASGPEGVQVPADLILLQNPALDGLAAFQLVEYLKRTGAQVELRHPDGQVELAPGPVIVSVTSEADWVTRVAYPAGQRVENNARAFRRDMGDGLPPQSEMANRAHGHLDFLISHRARLKDGEIVLERVPGAYNDTPFWIVQTSEEICRNHSDIYNPDFIHLVEQITKMNRLYDTGIQTWITQDRASLSGRSD